MYLKLEYLKLATWYLILIHSLRLRAITCFLAMKVTWPCHWCTDGMTLGQESDDLSRPLLDLLRRWSTWPTGAHGCILDLLLVSRDISLYYILVLGDWRCVRYTSFTAWELMTPTLEVSPHIILGVPRSPLRMHGYLLLLDTWLDLGFILCSYPKFPNSYITLHCFLTPLLHYCYLLPLYLFTELS